MSTHGSNKQKPPIHIKPDVVPKPNISTRSSAVRTPDTSARSSDTAASPVNTAGRSSDTAARQVDSAARSSDAAASPVNTTTRFSDAAARPSDATSRYIDMTVASHEQFNRSHLSTSAAPLPRSGTGTATVATNVPSNATFAHSSTTDAAGNYSSSQTASKSQENMTSNTNRKRQEQRKDDHLDQHNSSASQRENTAFYSHADSVDPPQPPSLLQCNLCEAPYDTEQHLPKLLPCHHSFCLSCLSELGQGRQQVRCPDKQCRRKWVIKDGGASALQTNFYVTHMQTTVGTPFRKASTDSSQNVMPENTDEAKVCKKHLNQPLLFYCTTCQVPICMNCTVIDHDKTSGHRILDIASVMTEKTEQLGKKIESVDSSLDSYQRSLNSLKTELLNLEIAKDTTVQSLEETFASLKAKMEEKRRELLTKADTLYQEKRQSIIGQAQVIKKHVSGLHELKDNAKSTMDNMTRSNITAMHKGLDVIKEIDKVCSGPIDQPASSNAYLKCELKQSLLDYMGSIDNLAEVQSESGLPSVVSLDQPSVTACIESTIRVLVKDLNGEPLSNYPLAVQITDTTNNKHCTTSQLIPLSFEDEGSYSFTFRPRTAGKINVQVMFHAKPISGASTDIIVAPNNPVLTVGSEGKGQGQMLHPTSVAVSGKGNIYVADMGNKRIQVFDSSGKYVQHFSVGGSKSTTYDIAINHATSELLCSKVGPNDGGILTGNTIRIFGLRGEKLKNFTNPEMQRSMFVTVNSKGHIICTDSAQHCWYIYSKEGVPIKKLGSLGQGHGSFNFPSAIASGKDDTILIADTSNDRVQIFNRSGRFLRQIGPTIAELNDTQGLKSPCGLAVDEDHILVADSLNRVLVFHWDLRLVGVLGSEGDPIDKAYNLGIAPDGHVFVADFQNNCVKKYRLK